MADRGSSLAHLDLAPYPSADLLDLLTRGSGVRLSRLEEVKDVLGARCCPESEKMMIRIGEGSTAADRHEPRVPDLGEDHGWPPSALVPLNTLHRATNADAGLARSGCDPVTSAVLDSTIAGTGLSRGWVSRT